jgi:hypothetical protein
MAATAVATSRTRLAAILERSPGLVPCTLAFGVLVWFAADEGGFRTTTWMPALLLLGAALLVCLGALPRPHPSRPALAAVLLLAAYGLFCLLSVLWAEQQELAWDAGNRVLLYAVILALCSLWPLRGRSAAVVLGAFGLAIAAIALIELLRTLGATEGIQYFDEARFAEPVGYVNANAALWMSAMLPCGILAGRRGVPAPVRGLLLGAAGLLAGAALLGQSRGWLMVLPLVGLLALLAVPGRGRTIVAFAAVGGAILLILEPLLEVYRNWHAFQAPGPELDRAVRALLLTSGGLAVLGTLAALVDGRVHLSARRARQVSGAVVVVLALATSAVIAGYAVVERSPISAVSDAWNQFKRGGKTRSGDSPRLTAGFSTYRYDYWRVGWREFKRRPLLGAGADNFGRAYLREGESSQTPLYPHNTEMVALAETGLVGGVLLGGALLAAVLAGLPGRRRPDVAGAAAGAGIVIFGYWLLHSSVDWFWEFPGLVGPALAGLALAIAVGSGRVSERDRAAPVLERRRALVLAAVAALLVGLSVVPPWLSAREQRRATEIAAASPDAALKRLERAAWLNPLSPVPDKAAAIIEMRRGRYAAAAAALRKAFERDSGDSGLHLLLGVVESEAGRPLRARQLVAQAHRLAPRDEVVAATLRELRRAGRVDPRSLDRRIQRDVRLRIGRD